VKQGDEALLFFCLILQLQPCHPDVFALVTHLFPYTDKVAQAEKTHKYDYEAVDVTNHDMSQYILTERSSVCYLLS
jgi:hypothetical protein